jgi:hypothetical protein
VHCISEMEKVILESGQQLLPQIRKDAEAIRVFLDYFHKHVPGRVLRGKNSSFPNKPNLAVGCT